MKTLAGIALALSVRFTSSAGAVELPVIADSYVDQKAGLAYSNYGSSGIPAVASARVALVRFNPSLVAQTSGGNVRLDIKVLLTKNQSNAIEVHPVLSTWSESTVTAHRLPALGPAITVRTITPADPGKVVSFDVSGAIAEWRSNPQANFGGALVPTAPAPNVQLGSREGGNAAVLSIRGPVQDNEVTVSSTGGDHTDPVAAAKNALEGDQWCANAALPCVIKISAIRCSGTLGSNYKLLDGSCQPTAGGS